MGYDRQLARDRLEAARSIPISDVAQRLAIPDLKRAGGEIVGPCPQCGGRDRFAINPQKGVFNCRVCGAHGSGIDLVRHVLSCEFGAALDYLVGARAIEISDEERRRRRAAAERAERKREADAARFRRKAIEDGRRIWRAAVDPHGTLAADYLAARGVPVRRFPPTIRFLGAHPYRKKIDGSVRTLHTGPAMISAVLSPGDQVTAVHQTWLDPDQPGQKARILYGGEAQAAKMVRGSKKGGAIRLSSAKGCTTLVMGEGIETTLSAMHLDQYQDAAYWAGIDLGNMAGRMARAEDGRRWSGLPDLADTEAFVPPSWVRRLIFLMDGDSQPAMTRAKLEAGLRRAMALVPGLVGEIVTCDPGKDLNDMLLEEDPE
ncbi:DUF7146 domain-containing protein [Maritimibacter alexandrii]|uniref:DUF7146 domain-containing protein n=1 Tax=Maritimibacter alexandrii TaxID=2570355 RepID=UPI001F2D112D|nr:CHC2 zinc finger domain-containing protein [Maritimibacter alexandrii]